MDSPKSVSDEIVFFVGTYAKGDEGGIYRYALNTTDGTVKPLGVTPKLDSPSFLAINQKGTRLYAVMLDGDKTDKVVAFAIDPKTFELKRLNSQPSHGAHPCHVMLDAKDQHAIIANYSGGSVTIYPIAEDGLLKEASDVVKHTGGSGVDAGRQKGPHPHMVNVSPQGGFVYVPDLGQDRIKNLSSGRR